MPPNVPMSIMPLTEDHENAWGPASAGKYELGPEQIRAYQVYSTQQRKLASTSLVIGACALRFLYKFQATVGERLRDARQRSAPADLAHGLDVASLPAVACRDGALIEGKAKGVKTGSGMDAARRLLSTDDSYDSARNDDGVKKRAVRLH